MHYLETLQWMHLSGMVVNQNMTPIANMVCTSLVKPIERDQHAYLMSAAPDLLQCLKSAIRVMGRMCEHVLAGDTGSGELIDVLTQSRDAVDKAQTWDSL